jgi:hypothetical protein
MEISVRNEGIPSNPVGDATDILTDATGTRAIPAAIPHFL